MSRSFTCPPLLLSSPVKQQLRPDVGLRVSSQLTTHEPPCGHRVCRVYRGCHYIPRHCRNDPAKVTQQIRVQLALEHRYVMTRYRPSLRSRMKRPRSRTMLGTYDDAPNAGSVHHLHRFCGGSTLEQSHARAHPLQQLRLHGWHTKGGPLLSAAGSLVIHDHTLAFSIWTQTTAHMMHFCSACSAGGPCRHV